MPLLAQEILGRRLESNLRGLCFTIDGVGTRRPRWGETIPWLPVITIWIGGMFTSPKFVVYGVVLPTLGVYIPYTHHIFTIPVSYYG